MNNIKNKCISHRTLSSIILSLFFSIVTCFLTTLFIRKIGTMFHTLYSINDFNRNLKTYAVIFDQLQHAKLTLPVFLNSLLSFLYSTLILRIGRNPQDAKNSKKHLILRICFILLITIVFLPFLFVITLWFTRVNEIQFGIVTRFLFEAIQNGVL